MVLANLLTLLKDQAGWAAVVLEEESLPIINKLPNSTDRRVVYIRNPSRLHEALSAMVGRQLGCWILRLTSGSLQKYYCGTGYRNQEL